MLLARRRGTGGAPFDFWRPATASATFRISAGGDGRVPLDSTYPMIETAVASCEVMVLSSAIVPAPRFRSVEACAVAHALAPFNRDMP